VPLTLPRMIVNINMMKWLTYIFVMHMPEERDGIEGMDSD
jgi:hypothetical protein